MPLTSARAAHQVRVRPGGSVISGAGAVITERLLPESQRRQLGFVPMIKAVKPSISHIYAFVGLEGTTEELGLHGGGMHPTPRPEPISNRLLAIPPPTVHRRVLSLTAASFRHGLARRRHTHPSQPSVTYRYILLQRAYPIRRS